MPLNYQRMSVPLGLGLDTKGSQKALPPGRLVQAIDGVFTEDGAFRKRYGYSRLGPAGGPADGTTGELAIIGDRLLASAGEELYEYAANHGTWRDVGPQYSLAVKSTVVRNNNNAVTQCDAYSRGGYRCVIWQDSAGLTAEVIDEGNGAVIDRQLVTNTISGPAQVQAVTNGGNTIFLIMFSNVGKRVVVATGTITWDPTVYTLWNTGVLGALTATRYTTNGTTLFGVAASATGVVLQKYNSALTSLASAVYGFSATATSPLGIGLEHGGTYVFLGAVEADDGKLHLYTSLQSNCTLVSNQVLDATVVPNRITICDPGTGTGFYFYDEGSGTTARIHQAEVNVGGSINNGPQVWLRSATIASDAIGGSNLQLWVSYHSQVNSKNAGSATTITALNAAHLLVNFTDTTPISAPRVAGRLARQHALVSGLGPPYAPSSMSAGQGGESVAGALVSVAGDTSSLTEQLSFAGAAVLECALTPRMRSAPALRDLVLSGGSASCFDGFGVAEQGFHVFPEVLQVLHNPSAAARANTTAYAVGQVMALGITASPSLAAGHLYLCIQAGTSAGAAGSGWPQTGGTKTDGTVVWRDMGVGVPAAFIASHTYAVGNCVVPTAANNRIYVVTAQSSASGTEPAPWPTTVGTSVVSGGVTFTCAAIVGDGLGVNSGAPTYFWSFVYEQVDDAGQLHQSEPSLEVALDYSKFSAEPLPAAYLSVTNLRITSKPDVRIGVYRRGFGGVSTKVATLINDPTTDFQTYWDTIGDTVADEGLALYADSELPNEPPPSCDALAVWGQRVVCNDLEDPFKFWPSKLLADGFGAAWSSELVVPVDATFGEVRGFAQMDDYLVVFQERRFSLFTPGGPDNTGAGSPFVPARPMATDVGCTNPDSIVVTPLGVFFESEIGIYLLTRDFQTKFVGAELQGIYNGPVNSADLVPNTTQVRFTSSGDNLTYVYDYRAEQWSTFTVYGTDAVAWNGLYVFFETSTGDVDRETVNLYQNANTSSYTLQLQIGPIRFDGVQGYGAVRSALIMLESGAGALQVQAWDDYGQASPTQTGSKAYTAADGFTAQVEFLFRKIKMQAVSLTLTIAADPSAAAIVGLDMLVGVFGGRNRVPAAKRIG